MDPFSFFLGFYIFDNVYACMILRDASCQICHMADCHRKSFHISRPGLHLTADAYRVSGAEIEHENEIEFLKKEREEGDVSIKVTSTWCQVLPPRHKRSNSHRNSRTQIHKLDRALQYYQ